MTPVTRHPAFTVVTAANTPGTGAPVPFAPTPAPDADRPAGVYRLTPDRAQWPDALDALTALRHR